MGTAAEGCPASCAAPERERSGSFCGGGPRFRGMRIRCCSTCRCRGCRLSRTRFGIGREPPDPHVLGRQAVPDRQQEAGGEPEARLPAGRMSRTRSCTPPSSIMREDAGRTIAAHFERALTASLGFPSGPGSRSPISSAATASSGTSLSRRTISTSSLTAQVPGCS